MKRVIILLSIIIVFSASACAAEKTDAELAPLIKMASSVIIEDTQAYKSAFLPAYISTLEETVSKYGSVYFGTDGLDSYISSVIAQSSASLEDEYGKNVKVTAKIVSKEQYTSSELESYIDYYTDAYSINTESTEEAYKLNCDITVKGSGGKKTTSAVVSVIKCGGKWYLHPNMLFYPF